MPKANRVPSFRQPTGPISGDRAVSPVVAVLLLFVVVAIVLAAVVAAFVFGGGAGESMPEATLQPQENPTAGEYGYLNLTIAAGPNINTSELEAVGGRGIRNGTVTIQNDATRLAPGDSIVIRFTEQAQPADTVRILWSPPDSETTGVFFTHELSGDWSRP